jgi:hypothetical protein
MQCFLRDRVPCNRFELELCAVDAEITQIKTRAQTISDVLKIYELN